MTAVLSLAAAHCASEALGGSTDLLGRAGCSRALALLGGGRHAARGLRPDLLTRLGLPRSGLQCKWVFVLFLMCFQARCCEDLLLRVIRQGKFQLSQPAPSD